MREQYYETEDTLRQDQLPDGDVNVEYRPDDEGRGYVLAMTLFACAICGAGVTLLARFLSSFQTNGFIVVGTLVVGFFCLCWAVLRGRFPVPNNREYPEVGGREFNDRDVVAGNPEPYADAGDTLFFVALILPALLLSYAFVSCLGYAHFLFFPLALPVIYIVHRLCDQIAYFYARWLLGHPLFPEAERNKLGRLWDERWSNRNYRRNYILSWTVVGFVSVLLVIVRFLPGLLPFNAAVILLLGILLIFAIPWLRGIEHHSTIDEKAEPPFAQQVAAVWNALVCWLHYDPHPYAPGVLRIPVRFPSNTSKIGFSLTTKVQRDLLLTGVLAIIFTPLVLSAGFYFPFGMLHTQPWENVAIADMDPAAPVATSDVVGRLSPSNKLLLSRMSGRERDTFLDSLRAEESVSVTHQAQQEAVHRMHAFLGASPENWMLFGLRGAVQHATYFMCNFLLAAIASSALPIVFFLGIMLTTTGKHLALVANLENNVDKEANRTTWHSFVDRVQASDNSIESNSLYLGIHEAGQYPVLLPRDALREHAHLLGDTGSGKTALGLAPMISQLARMIGRDCEKWRRYKSWYDAPDAPEWRKKEPPPIPEQLGSIVVIDLKGDEALFQGARIEARNAGLPFKWYTNLLGHSTYAFNPIEQTHVKKLSLNQRSELILQALGLSHGEGYGRGYYSGRSRAALLQTLHSCGPEIQCFRDIYKHLTTQPGSTTKQKEDAQALTDAIEILATQPGLNVCDSERHRLRYGKDSVERTLQNQIDMIRLFQRPQVLYFYLPASLEADTVREIGKLALYSVLSSALYYQQHKPKNVDEPTRQIYLFIDEFQQIVSTNLEIILRQARSLNVAAILANQTVSDLKTQAADLTPIVQANTRLKQFFAATDLTQQDMLSKGSGETIDYVISEKFDASSWTIAGIQEKVAPRLTQNDVIRVSDDMHASIVQLSRGDGFARFGGFPFIMKSTFHITPDEYTTRRNAEWPSEDGDGTFTPTEDTHPDFEDEPPPNEPKRTTSEEDTTTDKDSQPSSVHDAAQERVRKKRENARRAHPRQSKGTNT